jgi:hypothetical protein
MDGAQSLATGDEKSSLLREIGTFLPDYTLLKLNGAEMKAEGTFVKQKVFKQTTKV